MTLSKFAWLPICSVLVIGCVAVTDAKDVPAVIENPARESHAVLARAVSELLGHEVTLADDAFTKSDRLIVEPARLRDAQGHLAQGREPRPPVSFRLIRNGATCAVMREDSRTLKQLEGVRCREFK